jgi:hypothetical protein
VTLLAVAWLRPPATPLVSPPVRPAPIAPPEVVVHVQPPPPAAAEPVIGTRCAPDIATVGVPSDFQDSYASALLPAAYRYQEYEATTTVRGAALDPDDCTIAVWTRSELFASWDGGATFARHEVALGIATAAVTPRRVVVLRSDGALGVVRAGATELAWRELGTLASSNPDPMSLSARGDWILIHGGASLGVSRDDGATWRYVVPPPGADVFEITADGRIWGTDYQPAVEDEEVDPATIEEPEPPEPRFYVTDLRTARWRDDARALRKKGAPAWTYDIVGDRSWGCGGTRKIIALHHGREVATLFWDIYDGIDAPRVISNGRVSYALLEDASYRLRGKRSVAITPAIPIRSGNAVGVDSYGTVIAVDAAGLLRWSEQGGLRRLWTAPGAPAESR